MQIIHKSLTDDELEIGFYATRAMTHMIRNVGTEELHVFQNLVPPMIQMIKNLVSHDEERACEAMEVFDELIECEVTIIVPHIKPIIELSLLIAAQDTLEDSIRVKAISLLGRLTR